jgi:hypothetical protein
MHGLQRHDFKILSGPNYGRARVPTRHGLRLDQWEAGTSRMATASLAKDTSNCGRTESTA